LRVDGTGRTQQGREPPDGPDADALTRRGDWRRALGALQRQLRGQAGDTTKIPLVVAPSARRRPQGHPAVQIVSEIERSGDVARIHRPKYQRVHAARHLEDLGDL